MQMSTRPPPAARAGRDRSANVVDRAERIMPKGSRTERRFANLDASCETVRDVRDGDDRDVTDDR